MINTIRIKLNLTTEKKKPKLIELLLKEKEKRMQEEKQRLKPKELLMKRKLLLKDLKMLLEKQLIRNLKEKEQGKRN